MSTILAQTEARLIAAKAEVGLKLIEGAAEFAALKSNPPRHQMPAAYVIGTSDRANPSELIGVHRQHVARGVAILLALGNMSDPRGDSATKAMELLVSKVELLLAGWKPEGASHVMQLVGGRVMGLRDQVVWRQVDFSVETRVKPTGGTP